MSEKNIYVRVLAGVNILTREARWEFQSLDPETGNVTCKSWKSILDITFIERTELHVGESAWRVTSIQLHAIDDSNVENTSYTLDAPNNLYSKSFLFFQRLTTFEPTVQHSHGSSVNPGYLIQ